ncbi:hypothetical protein E8E14_009256 [Neopestalotiopsis sp. 37M]|nr:hypothetical protein E8E14_009256 [Neopestalotiopsis sp. 37M]
MDQDNENQHLNNHQASPHRQDMQMDLNEQFQMAQMYEADAIAELRVQLQATHDRLLAYQRSEAAHQRAELAQNLRDYQWLATPYKTWSIPGHDWEDRRNYYKREFIEQTRGTRSLTMEEYNQQMINSATPGLDFDGLVINEESAAPKTREHDAVEHHGTTNDSRSGDDNLGTSSTSEHEVAEMMDPRMVHGLYGCFSPPDGTRAPFNSACNTPVRSNTPEIDETVHPAPQWPVGEENTPKNSNTLENHRPQQWTRDGCP